MKVESVYIPTSIYNQKSSAKFLSEIKKTETSDAVVFDKERRENRKDEHLTDEEQHLHEDVDQHDVVDTDKPRGLVSALDITV